MDRKKLYSRQYRLDQIKDYSVYYLPEEHYVGVTRTLKRRMRQHRYNGKVTDRYELIMSFKSEADALRLEGKFHELDYRGKHSKGKKY